jgi:hypothetical protein
MAKFQCNASKTILEVFAEYDINGMRHNPSYTELQEEADKPEPVVPVKKAPVKKITLEEE